MRMENSGKEAGFHHGNVWANSYNYYLQKLRIGFRHSTIPVAIWDTHIPCWEIAACAIKVIRPTCFIKCDRPKRSGSKSTEFFLNHLGKVFGVTSSSLQFGYYVDSEWVKPHKFKIPENMTNLHKSTKCWGVMSFSLSTHLINLMLKSE